MKKLILIILVPLIYVSCISFQQKENQRSSDDQSSFPEDEKIEKTDTEWKSILAPDVYYVTREAGTEKPFTSELLKNKKEGTYVCSNCALPLFSSATKFKSGTGWPSFYDKFKDMNVTDKADNAFGWNRTEVLCARCDAHLGHVFEDGPAPTGLRYCINGLSLKFEEK